MMLIYIYTQKNIAWTVGIFLEKSKVLNLNYSPET